MLYGRIMEFFEGRFQGFTFINSNSVCLEKIPDYVLFFFFFFCNRNPSAPQGFNTTCSNNTLLKAQHTFVVH